PRRLQTTVPRDLETICLKCLHKEPRKRYVRAAALAADLQRFLGGKPIQARPVSTATRVWRWCQRRPAVASLAAALVAVGIASLIGLTFLWLRAEDLRHEAEANLDEVRRQQQ